MANKMGGGPPKGRKTMSILNPMKKDKDGSPRKERPSTTGAKPSFNASSPRATVMMPS